MSPKKILFACAPFDGHFNPLTGLAVHLKQQGHDVRWYAQQYYADKLRKLNIRHYKFDQADQINQVNLDRIFPKRAAINNTIKKINFDIQNVFVRQGPLYYRDIQNISNEFDFDLLIADTAFTGVPYVKELMNKPVFSIGVLPLSETSRDLAPSGLGMTPSTSIPGKLKQHILRFVAQKILFGASNRLSVKTLKDYGIDSKYFLFDEIIRRSTLVLQSGAPGFEYYRSDLSHNIRFIGPLFPYMPKNAGSYTLPAKGSFEKTILVTQGTVEKDVNKIIVPVLEAYKGTNTLVIATTGGSGTAELRKKYPHANIIIEDFIPFSDVLPHCDVYITNGGYGGVMLGVQHKIPMVVAGVHEGKNEICARVGYFKLGINLKTEKPSAAQIIAAVDEVISNAAYKKNVTKLSWEFSAYKPAQLLQQYMSEIFEEEEMNHRAEGIAV